MKLKSNYPVFSRKLGSVLSRSSFFCEDADSVSFIKEILDKKKLKDTFSSNVEHRYCAHEKFSLLVFTKDEVGKTGFQLASEKALEKNKSGKKEGTPSREGKNYITNCICFPFSLLF